MRNLLWKEWREQAWQLAFGCVVLSAMAAVGLHARMVADAVLLDWVCFVGVTLVPVLASTALVPAERADGGLATLAALPVSPAAILAAKAVLGVLLCVGPLAAAGVVSVAMAGGREVYTGGVAELYARSALASATLFAWMFALTVRLPNEARAALVAVGVLVIWMLASAGLMAAGEPSYGGWSFAASPFAFVVPVPAGQGGPSPFGIVLGVQAVLVAAVGWLAVRLFGTGTATA